MPFETDKGGGFKIDASDLLKTGVYPERFDRQIPMWETVNGVQYTEFGMRRKAGRRIIKDYKESPFNSETPARGITATREFNTKVAYMGDLRNIYSYVLSDPLANPPSSPSYNIVGSGYNLLRTSVGTEWDEGQEIDIVSAVMTRGTLSITTAIPHGLISGIPFSIAGLGFTASQIDPNGPQVANYPTGVSPAGPTIISVTGVGGQGDFATYTVSAGSKIILGQTNWDASSTTWDEGINEADQWNFDTFGSFVVGAAGSGRPVIKKNNVNFNTYYKDNVSGGTIVDGGSDYLVGDLLSVDSVLPITSTGLGLTAEVTEVNAGEIVNFKIINFGSGYGNGDVVTFSGGTDSATATLTVPNIDFDKLECFHRQGPHMLAFNYTKGPVDYSTSFAWCSADNLDDWVGAATNTAGSLLIREAETPIRCVCQLGTSLAVYTASQMFIVNYVGLPNIFGYQVALEGSIGAVSPNSVVSVGRKNYGVNRDGFFVTDGASVELIGLESGINQFFRDEVSDSELAQIYGFNNSKENEVVWAVPLGSTQINKEMYFNYKTGQWGMRDQSISCYLDRGVFDNLLSGDNLGVLYEEGKTASLQNPNVFAITKAHDLNNADRIKEVSAVRVGIEKSAGSGSPTFSVGFSATIDATPTFLPKDSFIIDDTFKSFPIRAAGRYITIKVESSGVNDDWTLTNLVIQGRFEGER